MATIANETGLSQGDILRLDENMTRWARENVAPAVAMRAMGWSSAQQLLAYTNLRNQDVGHAFGTAARRLSLVLPDAKRPAKKATK